MPADPLGELFPAAQIADEPSLNLKRLSDAILDETTDSGASIRRIEFEFDSFEWAGQTWRNRAALCIPAESPEPYRDAALIYASGGDKQIVPIAQMGIACVGLIDAPGKRYGIANPGALMSYGSEQYMKTGDPRWLGYPWLARIFMRAITAARSMPEFGDRRFVVTGGSKWGAGAWIAAGADDRIVGAVPASWNIGNVEKALDLKARRLGMNHKAGGAEAKGPGFQTTAEQIETYSNPRGQRGLAYVDPFRFRDRLAGKAILYMAGTNDPLFSVDADTVFLPEMHADVRVLLVPNAGHGEKGIDPRPMWLAHVFAGRDVPRIETRHEANQGQLIVEAQVESRTAIESVTLWSAADSTRTFLDAVWSSIAMEALDEGRYRASIPAPDKGSVGYIVMVEDDDPATVPGVITSGFHEWPPFPAE